MFFGLGPGELLLIAAIIALIAGPKAIPKMFKAAKKAQDVKSKLTGQAVVEYLMDDGGKGKRGKKKKSKGQSKPAEKDA
jgi:Sec-independent protein translocase protein TatA